MSISVNRGHSTTDYSSIEAGCEIIEPRSVPVSETSPAPVSLPSSIDYDTPYPVCEKLREGLDLDPGRMYTRREIYDKLRSSQDDWHKSSPFYALKQERKGEWSRLEALKNKKEEECKSQEAASPNRA